MPVRITLFLLQLAATLCMTGLIWFVQIVHYPLFARVGETGFSLYSQQHARRTGWVVAPLMLIELATAFLFLFNGFRPPFFPRRAVITGLILLAVIWLSTAFLQIPQHDRLAQGFDPSAAQRLVAGNWLRTACWTLRTLLLLGYLWPALTLSGYLRQEHPKTLAHDAYIWQRHWNKALQTALTESAFTVRAWRVLAAEADARLDLTKISVDRPLLRQLAKPIVAVIRIDARGHKAALTDQLAAQIAAIVTDWKDDTLPVIGLEIDYDCATNQLRRYRDFLRLVRARVDRHTALSITALPAWIESSDLPPLLTETDESVLQVHSVMSPEKGLFNRRTARHWAQAWSAVSSAPFHLALPTYWSRVTWNEEGRVEAIESEVNRYGTGGSSHELIVDPHEISSLIADLQQSPPGHLAGIAWFRLPTAEDRRAWSMHTWYAVLKGENPPATPPLVQFKPDQAGAKDVYLINRSGLDTKLPSEVSISAKGCELADALPPYNWERQASGFRFRLKNDDLLRAGQERLVGWIRCSDGKPEGHALF